MNALNPTEQPQQLPMAEHEETLRAAFIGGGGTPAEFDQLWPPLHFGHERGARRLHRESPLSALALTGQGDEYLALAKSGGDLVDCNGGSFYVPKLLRVGEWEPGLVAPCRFDDLQSLKPGISQQEYEALLREAVEVLWGCQPAVALAKVFLHDALD